MIFIYYVLYINSKYILILYISIYICNIYIISYTFFIHLSIERHLGSFRSWLLWTTLQWTWKCRYLFKVLISYPLGIYPEDRWLDYMIALFLVLYSCLSQPEQITEKTQKNLESREGQQAIAPHEWDEKIIYGTIIYWWYFANPIRKKFSSTKQLIKVWDSE